MPPVSLRDPDAAGVDDCCCLDESVVDEVAQSNASASVPCLDGCNVVSKFTDNQCCDFSDRVMAEMRCDNSQTSLDMVAGTAAGSSVRAVKRDTTARRGGFVERAFPITDGGGTQSTADWSVPREQRDFFAPLRKSFFGLAAPSRPCGECFRRVFVS